MAYWLIKSEPDAWSWDQHVAAGIDEWDGIRNYQARNNLDTMKIGELAFFYHSRQGLEIVGISRVANAAHPDSTDETGTWRCADFEAVQPLPRPVTMAEIKAEPALAEMVLVRNSRLSVQPVREQEWDRICRMAGMEPLRWKTQS